MLYYNIIGQSLLCGTLRTMPPNAHKASYTIACTSSFRDDVNALATTLRANVADIARSVLLTIPEEIIRSIPDPGGPPPGDREPIQRRRLINELGLK